MKHKTHIEREINLIMIINPYSITGTDRSLQITLSTNQLDICVLVTKY